MPKILVVEDDDTFREILKTTIKKDGYEVEGAADGKSAQYILSVHDFDIVLSDVKMPSMDGIELLQWIKKNKTLPVILMTGFSEILEIKEAAELGADGFLPKPFSQSDLNETILRCLKTAKKTETLLENDDEYCKVSVEDFISGTEIPFSIYLRLPNKKYIKIGYKGEDISLDRVKSYKMKDVNYLYLRKEDFSKYVGLTLKIAKALVNTKQISREKKSHFLRHAGEVILERVHVNGVDDVAFRDSSDFVKTTLSIISDNSDLVELLGALNHHADFLYAHSLGVSLYGVMFAKQLRWTSAPTVFKVSMGGLFHDIGKKEIDRMILDKTRVQMSQVERAEFETHPKRGMEILSGIEGVPQEVIQIAFQHHENCAGMGYPLALTKGKISPLARLISVVNIFCEYAIATPQRAGMSAHDSITQMLHFRQDGLDPEFLAALKSLFQYEDERRAS